MAYQVGDTARIPTTFTTGDPPVATDPTAVSLTVLKPDATTSTPTPVKDDVGVYHADVVLDQSGVWVWRWEGTGAVAGADEGVLHVAASLLTGLVDPHARLTRMVAADSDPVLSDVAISDLLAIAAQHEGAGGLDLAAAEGWSWKAAIAASRVDIADEQARISRGQLIANCRAMEKHYRVKAEVAAAHAAAPLARFAAQAFEPLPRESSRYGGTAP